MPNPTPTKLLGNGSEGNLSQYSPGAFTKTRDKPCTVGIYNAVTSGTPATPTLSALPTGVTATQGPTLDNGTKRLTVFWLTDDASLATYDMTGWKIDIGGTPIGCTWWVDEWADASNTMPSGGDVVSATGTGTAVAADLTTITSGNSGYGVVGAANNTTHAAGTNYTLTGTRFAQNNPGMSTSAEYRANSDDPTIDLTLGTSSAWIIHAIEIAAGTVTVTGTVAVTLAAATSAASGSSVTGTVAQTTANATSAAAGGTGPSGTLAQTTANATSAASGSSVTGTLAKTLDDATCAASGTASGGTVTGTVNVTTANATSGASGSSVTGTLAQTTANATSSAAGGHGPSGSLALTLANATSVATGATGAAGTLAVTLANAIATASGSSVTGTVAALLAAATCVATGTHTPTAIPDPTYVPPLHITLAANGITTARLASNGRTRADLGAP